MARIQVLPLPAETVGSVTSTPFVLIIDQAEGDPLFGGDDAPEIAERIRVETGAMRLLVVPGELTVANVDEKLHQAAQVAVMRALCPEQTVEA